MFATSKWQMIKPSQIDASQRILGAWAVTAVIGVIALAVSALP
jgi:hypothetical protein